MATRNSEVHKKWQDEIHRNTRATTNLSEQISTEVDGNKHLLRMDEERLTPRDISADHEELKM